MFESLYIHFPYCLYKCHYCDFNSYAYEKSNIPQNDYLQGLLGEIEFWQRRFPGPQKLKTIFFGGGTPSLMPPEHVATILQTIEKVWGMAESCEVTLESNPGTVTRDSFSAFKTAGINRVSLGIQSFENHNLQRFGRIHTGSEAKLALRAAYEVFENVSCDLIFGFPDQTLLHWQNDLQTMIDFGLPHASCYALTAEPQTQYSFDLKAGKYNATADDVMADMQAMTYDLLGQAGLAAYEISNFARPGYESRHNLAYWRYQSYLGLGAGATSQFVTAATSQRHTNFKRPQDYLAHLADGTRFFTEERVEMPDVAFEYLMMNLRLRDGFAIDDFCARWGQALWHGLQETVQNLCAQGLLQIHNNRLLVTRAGFLFNHRLVSAFFEPLRNLVSRPQQSAAIVTP